MRVLFQDFLSNKAIFFDLFDQAAKNVVEMATMLDTAVNTNTAAEREIIFKHINKKEAFGDDVTHKIYLYLNKIMFPPISRNDIHALAAAIDDVADYIKDASGKMYLYDIIDFVPAIKQIAAIILNAALDLEKAVNLLRLNRQTSMILELCRDIKGFERQADRIYYHAVADLFLNDKDAINLIKYREILHSLETTVNKCKSAADTVEVILINK
ncbi:DUF47 domain-containing protein [Mucilaginibacter sp.]|uniref:DUF47 domain-containing protein n=1 Tax=Mucilaginibacter sp. TaxID=1882438 RepID=UPI003D13CDD4